MYYEEKLIDGVWHYRTTPSMEFKPMSILKLSQKITELNKCLIGFRLEEEREEEEMDNLKEYKEKSLMLQDEFHPKFIVEIEELLKEVGANMEIQLFSEKADVGIWLGQNTEVIFSIFQNGVIETFNHPDCIQFSSCEEEVHFSEFSCEVLIDIISSIKTHISKKEIEVLKKELKTLEEKKRELQSQTEKINIKIAEIKSNKI